MATKKIRVYELARELGVENAVVLDLANELKIGVKSHSSSIDDPSADRVRRLAGREGRSSDPRTRRRARGRPASAAPRGALDRRPAGAGAARAPTGAHTRARSGSG